MRFGHKPLFPIVLFTTLWALSIAQTFGDEAPAITAQQYLEAGSKFYSSKDMSKAIESYKKALQIEPNNAIAHQSLGNAYYVSGQKAAALAEYQKALVLNPNNPKLTSFVQFIAKPETPNQKLDIDFHKNILPVLQKSCFACHVACTDRSLTSTPDTRSARVKAYNDNEDLGNSSVMLEKRKQKEIADGLDDFLMGTQFPFPDTRVPKKQLDKMERTLRRGMMPPETQAKLGLGEALSENDRNLLLDWIEQLRKMYTQ